MGAKSKLYLIAPAVRNPSQLCTVQGQYHPQQPEQESDRPDPKVGRKHWGTLGPTCGSTVLLYHIGLIEAQFKTMLANLGSRRHLCQPRLAGAISHPSSESSPWPNLLGQHLEIHQASEAIIDQSIQRPWLEKGSSLFPWSKRIPVR